MTLHWGALTRLSSRPQEFKIKLRDLVYKKHLSPEGGYSLLINGQPSNYRLDGQELFIVNEEDARSLVACLRKTIPSHIKVENIGYELKTN